MSSLLAAALNRPLNADSHVAIGFDGLKVHLPAIREGDVIIPARESHVLKAMRVVLLASLFRKVKFLQGLEDTLDGHRVHGVSKCDFDLCHWLAIF